MAMQGPKTLSNSRGEARYEGSGWGPKRARFRRSSWIPVRMFWAVVSGDELKKSEGDALLLS